MTPAQRILRTLIQVVVAVAVAVPSAVALLDLDATLAAKVVGVAGALVIVVTAVQNSLEGVGVLPKVLTGRTRRERRRAKK